ncbi:hypothetical protein FACS1894110_13330 [Spirochaetia bacterium]|nr:hypothetical protein FACS1894110_13330 [Spirochaetia bacterium]
MPRRRVTNSPDTPAAFIPSVPVTNSGCRGAKLVIGKRFVGHVQRQRTALPPPARSRFAIEVSVPVTNSGCRGGWISVGTGKSTSYVKMV